MGNNYLAYSTADNVAGIMAWPLYFGSPSMGTIVENSVMSIAVSCDGRKLLTLSGSGAVNLWNIDTRAIDQISINHGQNGVDAKSLVKPCIVDQIEDHFCYAQIRSHGEDNTEEIHASRVVALDDMPNIMRALGYYPSNAEIQCMVEEVELQSFLESKPPPTGISFDSFLSLFIRYRPDRSLSQEELDALFIALGGSLGKISKGKFIELLQSRGEPLTDEELADTLQILTGTDNAQEAFPETVDSRVFASLLGLEKAEP